LQFDQSTGAANVSPTRIVAEGQKESRFHIAGVTRNVNRQVTLIHATLPWRTDWLTYGLTDDGWTKPGTTARVRVFAQPGQKRAVTRTVTIQIWAPNDVTSRPF